MRIKKRTLPMYILLNCLTLGIYGFIVSNEVDKEINALCKGDGEKPKFSYTGAVALRGIAPVVGIIVGLILGIIGVDKISILSLAYFGDVKAIIIFAAMLSGGILFTALGTIVSGIYLKYWWYKQASRLKLNANRYGLTVKESGVDTFLYRTVMEVLFIPVSFILIVAACAIPLFIIWLITLADSIGAAIFAFILLFVFALPLMFFGMELTVGANFSMFFIFKNLNRFADVYRNGATSFDPMAYEYYPSAESKYPNYLPNLINGPSAIAVAPANEEIDTPTDIPTGVLGTTGSLIGVNGTCAGYNFDLTSGEEIIIGKDAKVSMVVIDPAYKEISRKHVGVCYDIIRDQYRVVDYSSNGTWANGSKLVPGQEVYLPHGTELKLANDKNTFRLG